MNKKHNLKQLLNLSFTDYTNLTYSIGKYDMPYINNNQIIKPDYIALYNNKKDYFKTDNTAIGFYQYDRVIDNSQGLFEAIQYNNKKKLDYFRKKFKDKKLFISPDYTVCGDVNMIYNLFQIYKSRIVSMWLIKECKAIVIPNITYGNENYFPYMLEGMEDCVEVSISIVGQLNNKNERNLLHKAIKYTVDNLNKLKALVVYTIIQDNAQVNELFKYAINNNVEVIIPQNALRKRNAERSSSNGKNK